MTQPAINYEILMSKGNWMHDEMIITLSFWMYANFLCCQAKTFPPDAWLKQPYLWESKDLNVIFFNKTNRHLLFQLSW